MERERERAEEVGPARIPCKSKMLIMCHRLGGDAAIRQPTAGATGEIFVHTCISL